MNAFRNTLGAERKARGWTQARMAALAGISRQSYAAIEAGGSIPSTEVALRLALGLGRRVEELFRLGEEAVCERVVARWAGSGEAAGRRVRLAVVCGETMAYGAEECGGTIGAADGVVVGREEAGVVVALLPERPPPADLVVVGCDPAFGLIGEALRRVSRTEVVWAQRSSLAALRALASGEAHVAGSHLRDPAGGAQNARWVEEIVPFACTRIGFAVWEQGILLAAGNPLGVGSVEDLARPGLRLVNREPGSGSRALLDARLCEVGIEGDRISGYGSYARGHMPVGEAIAAGLADAGVAIYAAGRALGLHVVPLEAERYELVVPNACLDLPAVQALMDTLSRASVRAQVEALGGYDASGMGRPCGS